MVDGDNDKGVLICMLIFELRIMQSLMIGEKKISNVILFSLNTQNYRVIPNQKTLVCLEEARFVDVAIIAWNLKIRGQ